MWITVSMHIPSLHINSAKCLFNLQLGKGDITDIINSIPPGRGLPYGSGLGLSRCLGPGECLHSFIHQQYPLFVYHSGLSHMCAKFKAL